METTFPERKEQKVPRHGIVSSMIILIFKKKQFRVPTTFCGGHETIINIRMRISQVLIMLTRQHTMYSL